MREFRALALAVVVFAMSVGFATAQSLAELAKKERERRDGNTSETKRVVTERELSRGYGELPSSLSRAEAQAREGGDEASETEEGEEQEDETQTQEHWQNRVKRARQDRALEQQMTSEDWGEGQRVGIDPRGRTAWPLVKQRRKISPRRARSWKLFGSARPACRGCDKTEPGAASFMVTAEAIIENGAHVRAKAADRG